MKILHAITGLQKAAGTSVFCGEVCNGLVALGNKVSLALPECPPGMERYPLDSRIKIVPPEHVVLGGDRYDIVHIHGLWSPMLHQIAQWSHGNNLPVVWSTHGMTAPWSMRHKWWKKKIAWLLYQKNDLRQAASIHCTTFQEEQWNQELGFENCFVAPLGTNEKPGAGRSASYKYLLFVGRIYPVKGLENLLRAWELALGGLESNDASAKLGNWKLKLVGPDQAGYQAKLEALAHKLGIERSIEFAGPKYGKELSEEYDQCECLVLPSFTENFGGVVIDALAHGKPCITSTFTPWKELQEGGCGWWVDNEPAELAQTIGTVINMEENSLHAMGLRGRNLVEEKYTWEAVVKRMVTGYEELLRG